MAHVDATCAALMIPVFKRTKEELEAILKEAGAEFSSPQSVAKLLGKLHDGGDGSQFLPCITMAIASLEMGGTVEGDFAAMMAAQGVNDEAVLAGFRRELGDTGGLFAAISRWALDALGETGPGAFPKAIQPWVQGTGGGSLAYTAAQCRGALANALLMNVTDTSASVKTHADGFGGLWFVRMMQSTKPAAAQKLACMLQYFQTSRWLEDTADVAREIVFERRASTHEGLDEFHSWALQESTRVCDASRCVLHDGCMESADDADAFVNFANATFGYGGFTAGCTQEEILQMCCPEFNVGMLHLGRMTDGEVVNVHNVRRFSAYKGYGRSFEYTGPWNGKPISQTILTMDATMRDHFSEHSVVRDIRKAYLAFRDCSVVTSGRWGCGAFGGVPAHKFAQQLVAASLADCSFYFSTFGDIDQCDEVLALVSDATPTACELLKAVLLASAEVGRSGKGFPSRLAIHLASGAQSAAKAKETTESDAPAE